MILATSTHSRTVPAIDKQLYAKYRLSAGEVEFVEENLPVDKLAILIKTPLTIIRKSFQTILYGRYGL